MKLLDIIKEDLEYEKAKDASKDKFVIGKEISELFSSDYVYPVNAYEDHTAKSRFDKNVYRTLRYNFESKDNTIYSILFQININTRTGRLDFMTGGTHPSMYPLINNHDSIKVLNTLKSIIDKHRDQIDSLQIHSMPERLKFYEKILAHMNIKYEYIDPQTIIAFLNK
jgi:hypothetical protein